LSCFSRGRHLGLVYSPTNDGRQALFQSDRALDFPCAAVGHPASDHKDDHIGGFDQATEPRFPIFAGGDVVLVEIRFTLSL
jgi:hypothetical protein